MGVRGPGAKPVRARASGADLFGEAAPVAPPLPDGTRAERVCAFLETLTITAGMHAGQKLAVRPWQRAIIEDLYRTDENGRRQVRQGLITCGRKNGKTAIVAGLALAHLCGPEAESRGQVFSAAADRAQAALLFNEMRAMILADRHLAARTAIREFKKEIEDVVTGSVYVALSSDARKAHGLSPSFWIADELAQWPSRDLLDALSSGTGARAEPLGIVISTQSADPFSAMSELVRYAQQVRDGIHTDPSFSGHLFIAPEDLDPWSPETWKLANPALGDFLSFDEMRIAAEQAQRIPARESAFRNLRLNQAVEPDERFIHRRDWDPLGEPFDVDELRGQRCFAGLDLSSAGDLTGLALWFPDAERLLAFGFLPARGLAAKERTDRASYGEWAKAGIIIPTPGSAIDKTFVAAKLRDIAEAYDLQGVAYDRWGYKDLETVLNREGIHLPLVPHGQGFKDFGPSTEEFERLVLQGRLHHGGNPLLRFALGNCRIEQDPAGARKPAKNRSLGRIDPLVAAIMAVGLAARSPAAPNFTFSGIGI